jgi:hypothetical protein
VAGLGLAATVVGCRTAGTWQALGPDHRTPVSVSTREGRQCVSVAERPDGCFDGVSVGTLVFGGGEHVAYAVQLGARWAIVHDGRVGSTWDGVGPPRLSPDGTRLAFPALDGERWRVVTDGEPGEEFDSVLAGTLQFDPTGRRVAFAGSRQGRAYAVVDGVRSRPWLRVAQLQFSPSGDHVGYAAGDSSGASVVIDGWVGPPHGEIGELVLGGTRQPTAEWGSPAGSAYAARERGPWRVRVDGAAGPGFDSVRELVMLPDGGAAYVAGRDGQEGLARDGRVDRWHERVVAVAFADDGRWGYVAEDGALAQVIVGGSVAAEGPWATDLAFGHGQRHAYVVGAGEGALVVDESGPHAFDLVVSETLQYVAGGRAWACLAGDRDRQELFVVADGVRLGRPFDWSEIVRQTRQGSGARVVRAWVAAEAERALADGADER